MDAESRARPEEAECKPRLGEVQDDGYETSNSGDPPRAPASPPPPPAAPLPPAPASPSPPDLCGDPPTPAALTAPPNNVSVDSQTQVDYPQDYPDSYRQYQEQNSYIAQHQQHFPFPKYGGDPFAFKRSPEAPYDMTHGGLDAHHEAHGGHAAHPLQHHQPHYKREDDMYSNGVKRECDDPYSFVEEEMMMMHDQHQHQHQQHPGHANHALMQHMQALHHQQMPHQLMPQPKKRGRKKKIKDENGMEIKVEGVEGAPVRVVKERKKHDRFNGMSEEEVSRRTLPDHLAANLDLVIIGINPGLFAAYKGHHYAGPGNHFWKCLYLSGLTREQMSADEDYKLLNFGIGFTNMVSRATKGSADLTRREIKEGSVTLLEKLQTFRPKVAVFNGKLIYEVFSGKKDFCFGKQPDPVQGTNTYMWVMPSSSARCAQLPRAADKVPFYAALKKFRDYLNGLVLHVDDTELVFPDNTARRPQDEQEIRRLTMEPDPGETIVLEDGTELPLKKKRGRPKKVKLENGEIAPPAPRAPRAPRTVQPVDPNGEQPAKKKRGRPKKIRPEEQAFLLQQQQQQQAAQQQAAQQQAAQQAAAGQQQQHGGGPGAFNQLPPAVYHQPMYSMDRHFPQGGGQNPAPNIEGALDMNMMGRYESPGPPPYSPAHYSPQTVSQQPVSAGTPGGSAAFPGSPGSAAFGASPPRAYSSPAPRPPYAHSPLYAQPNAGAPPPNAAQPAPFPQASPHGLHSYTPSPQHTPYSQHSSPAPPPPRTPTYPDHHFTQPPLCELSQDIGSAISPRTVSPGAPPDWEPPQRAVSPAASTADLHPGSNSNSSMGDYNKTNSVGSEMSPAGVSGVNVPQSGVSVNMPVGSFGVYDNERLSHPYAHSPGNMDKEHYHFSQDGNSVPESPRMDQMHQHQMYPNPNNYNRSTPEGSGDSQPGFRPPEQPHTPHHHPGSPAEYGGATKPKSQDVASKSLSGLESLVDQIPSIADGGVPQPQLTTQAGCSGGEPVGGVGAAGGALPEYAPALYPPYSYNAAQYSNIPNNGYNGHSYGGGFVGYGVGGWAAAGVVRPTPGYLPDWQYPYPPHYSPHYNALHYTPHSQPPALHQQAHYLSAPGLLELHKSGEPAPPVPAVPSVSFPGFC